MLKHSSLEETGPSFRLIHMIRGDLTKFRNQFSLFNSFSNYNQKLKIYGTPILLTHKISM